MVGFIVWWGHARERDDGQFKGVLVIPWTPDRINHVETAIVFHRIRIGQIGFDLTRFAGANAVADAIDGIERSSTRLGQSDGKDRFNNYFDILDQAG